MRRNPRIEVKLKEAKGKKSTDKGNRDNENHDQRLDQFYRHKILEAYLIIFSKGRTLEYVNLHVQ